MLIKPETIDLINSLFREGGKSNISKAKQELGRLLKQGPFNFKDKLLIARWHTMFGDPSRAIKVCGKELSFEQMMEATPDELVLQNYLTFLMGTIGAQYTNLRISKKLDEVCRARGLDMMKLDPQHFHHKAHRLRTAGYYERGIDVSNFGIEFFKEKGLKDDVFNLNVIKVDCLWALGRIEEAEDVLNNEIDTFHPERKTHMAIKERLYASHAMRKGDYQTALAYLKKSAEYSPLDSKTLMSTVLNAMLGSVYYYLEDYEKAKSHFLADLDIFSEAKRKAANVKECLYYLEKIPGYELTLDQQLSLKCHHGYSYFAVRCGILYKPSERHKLVVNIDPKEVNLEKETWLIQKNQIKPAFYADALKYTLENLSGELFDFYSGLRFSKDGVESIPETQLRCLAPIYGSGEFGINKWALIDIIYREEEFCFNYGEERLKYLISELKKKGFPIVRKKNFYYFEHGENESVIFPMDVPQQRLYAFLRVQQQKFKREDVEEVFGVHKATANRWIKSWLELGVVHDEQGIYVFS